MRDAPRLCTCALARGWSDCQALGISVGSPRRADGGRLHGPPVRRALDSNLVMNQAVGFVSCLYVLFILVVALHGGHHSVSPSLCHSGEDTAAQGSSSFNLTTVTAVTCAFKPRLCEQR